MYYDLVVYKRKVNQTCVYFMGYILLSDISIANTVHSQQHYITYNDRS